MERLIYAPEVTIYIRSEEGNTVFDVSEDIISGSVTRRLDAESSATVTLQNKFGKYTRKVKPMDRIAIFMRRMGEPMLVFTGYVDEAPFYQIRPGPVTIQASCTLKLLKNTYFDPGLSFMTEWMAKLGWSYNPATGMLFDGQGGVGNYDTPVDVGDLQGTLASLLAAALVDIGGWPATHIYIRSIPDSFKKVLYQIMVQEALQSKADYQRTIDRVSKILGVGLSTTASGATQLTPIDPTTIDVEKLSKMPQGNMTGEQVAAVMYAAGFRGEDLVTILAIAKHENGWTTSNKPNGAIACGTWTGASEPGCVGLMQINSNHEGTTFYSHIHPNGVTATYDKLADPTVQATISYSLYHSRGGTGGGGSDVRFYDWESYTGSDGVGSDGPYREHLAEARKAVNDFYKHRLSPSTVASDAAKKAVDDVAGVFKTVKDDVTNAKDVATGYVKHKTATSDNDPNKAKFLYPIAAVAGFAHNVTSEGEFGNNRGDHIHAGVDIDTHGRHLPLVACVNGTITTSVQSGIGGGNIIQLKQDFSDTTYVYMHCDTVGVKSGQHVNIGEKIGTVGSTGTSSGFIHLHFEKHPHGGFGYASAVDPDPQLKQAWAAGNKMTTADMSGGVTGADTTPTTQGQLTEAKVQEIARQAAWFIYSLPTVDSQASNQLTGNRALANDIPLMEWIQQIVQGSGRRFMSLPDGSFFAFFPDYFGWFGRTPYFIVKDIEILDLTIQVTDRELFTHIFGVGGTQVDSSGNPITTLYDLTGGLNSSMVASVEEEAFNLFVNPQSTWDKRKGKFVKTTFDPIAFLKRYGARPDKIDVPMLRNPILIWMATWTEFLKRWAATFQTDATFTFMPELLPGGIIELDGRITLFIEEVTHNFDMEGGFSTSASLVAPAAKNKNDNRFGGMALTGNNFGVITQLAKDGEIDSQNGQGGPSPDANKNPVASAPRKGIGGLIKQGVDALDDIFK